MFSYTQRITDISDIHKRGRHILYICGFKSALFKYIDVFKDDLPVDISEDEMSKINALNDDEGIYNLEEILKDII